MPNKLLYLGEILSGGKDFKPKMDELVRSACAFEWAGDLLHIGCLFFQTCFLPGTIALCVHHECGLPKVEAMSFAEELAYTCYLTFARQPTHLAAEITYYNSDPGKSPTMTLLIL